MSLKPTRNAVAFVRRPGTLVGDVVESTVDPVAELWDGLRHVQSLRFVARSAIGSGWDGVGVGRVTVATPDASCVTFTEAGRWHPDAGRETEFRNVFRWTLLGPESIRLEHLRFGPAHPVMLFDMVPGPGGVWVPAEPHRCGDDRYSAELWRDESGISLKWSITGPRKSERIDYVYSWAETADEPPAIPDER